MSQEIPMFFMGHMFKGAVVFESGTVVVTVLQGHGAQWNAVRTDRATGGETRTGSFASRAEALGWAVDGLVSDREGAA